jgi:thiamine pyrophosphate-dependent acetolactate synthase large subunit-like protein
MTRVKNSLRGMPIVAALQVLIDLRTADTLVVTNQASARIWPTLKRCPLDLHYNPSTMGGAVPLALGLALAQPGRQVLAVSGDGALLMSLGSLVTVVGIGVTNLTIVVLDNGLYEVTGGQKTAASGTSLDWPALARDAGFPSAVRFDELSAWQAGAAAALALPGPRFISLVVQPTPPEFLRAATPPMNEQIATIRAALAAGY